MATAATGLQTHIWNNNLKSIVLLAAYPLILLALLWGCAATAGLVIAPQKDAAGFAGGIVQEFWPLVLSVVAIWFIVSWFFHGAMINRMAHAHSVSRKDEPALYNLLENLCIARGLAMPRLNIIETHARNAYASGISEKTYAVTVTRGLMNALTRDELEAVLAHELTHIINRDVRLLMVTVIFTGMIGFAAQMAWSSFRYNMIFSGRRGGDKGGGMLLVLAIGAVLWLGYMATLFMRFALSRRREYMADAGAVALTRKPEAMMSALMRIAGRDRIPQAPADIAMMCIENHVPFLGLFATHPPIEARIKAISEITRTPVPVLPHAGPAPADQSFGDRSRVNPWLSRTRGKRRMQ